MTRIWTRNATAPRSRRSPRPYVELLEDRCVLDVRSFTGFGNNLIDPTLGVAGGDLLRLSPAAYKPVANGGDDLNIPSMTYGAPTFVAGPRLVSNAVSNQATVLFGPTDINTVSQNSLSGFGYTWGQFLDHDMDLSPTLSGKIPSASWAAGVATITVADGLFRVGDAVTISGTGGFNGGPFTILTATPPGGATTFTFALATDPGVVTTFGTVANTTTKDGANGFPIPKDPTHPNDPIDLPGDPDSTLAFTRSIFNPATGITTPREQINVSTSFLDLSQVYGSSDFVATALRTLSGGLMKTSPGANGVIGGAVNDDLLPFNTTSKDGIPYFTTDELAALNMANDVGLVPNSDLFAAGDVRANEVIELTALHTLFVRNHNRIANLVAPQFASITDPVAR